MAGLAFDPSRDALLHPEHRLPPLVLAQKTPVEALCATLSHLAYVRFEQGQAKRLEDIVTAAGFLDLRTFHDARTNTQALCVTAPDGTCYISFRGTQSDRIRDILSDIAFTPVRWRGPGRIHRGFLRAWRSAESTIGGWIKDAGAAPLVVTGHSLGAALAIVMAAHHPHARLIVFGAPRVGTRAFATLFGDRDVRRFVDCADFVTRVPPPIGYAHISDACYIDRNGYVLSGTPDRTTIKADRKAARAAFRRMYRGKPGNVLFRMLADHAPINYVSAVSGIRVADEGEEQP